MQYNNACVLSSNQRPGQSSEGGRHIFRIADTRRSLKRLTRPCGVTGQRRGRLFVRSHGPLHVWHTKAQTLDLGQHGRERSGQDGDVGREKLGLRPNLGRGEGSGYRGSRRTTPAVSGAMREVHLRYVCLGSRKNLQTTVILWTAIQWTSKLQWTTKVQWHNNQRNYRDTVSC